MDREDVFYSVKIINWGKYQHVRGLRDIKRPSWFSVSNRISDDPIIAAAPIEYRWTWICILSEASSQHHPDGILTLSRRQFSGRHQLPDNILHGAIKYFSKYGLLRYRRKDPRTFRDRKCTLQYITEHNKTVYTETQSEIATQHGDNFNTTKTVNLLVEIWNKSKPSSLAEVKSVSSGSKRFKQAGARWRERPDREYWAEVFRRIGESSFLTGDNDRGWRADFEWATRPDKHDEIMSGKYERRTKLRKLEI